MRRGIRIGAAAVPGLLLAGASLVHPGFLGPSTAQAWWQLHIPLIPLFPLLGGAVLLVVQGGRGVLPWIARIGAYLYACLYTALDSVSGIAAGLVTQRTGGGAEVGDLFAVGDGLGHLGIVVLDVAVVVAATVVVRAAAGTDGGVRRAATWVVPGVVVLLVASRGFFVHHIFSPDGTWAMLGFAAGFALLAAGRTETIPVRSGT